MLLDFLRSLFWGPVGCVIPHMPSSFLYALAGGPAATLYCALDTKRRAIIEKLLKFIFAHHIREYDLKMVVRRSFGELLKMQAETFLFHNLNRKSIEKVIIIEGQKQLDQSLSKGKGVILLNSHFGNFQMVIAGLGLRGYRVGQIAIRMEEDKEKLIDKDTKLSRIHMESLRYRQRLESKLPAKFIQAQKFMRSAFKILQENGILIIAGDGREGTNFASIPFFGHTARFSLGAFQLAEKTGAEVLPTFTVRLKDNRHQTHIMESIFPPAKSSDTDPKAVGLSSYIDHLERFVRDYPCHYIQFLARCVVLLREGEIPIFAPLFEEESE